MRCTYSIEETKEPCLSLYSDSIGFNSGKRPSLYSDSIGFNSGKRPSLYSDKHGGVKVK